MTGRPYRLIMWASLYRTIGSLTDSERDFGLAAQRIQEALLTVHVPTVSALDIGVQAAPARQVGGDYIDLFLLDEHRLVFALGDASGKSLSAALNALMLRYLVRGLVRVMGSDDLESITAHTNNIVSDDLRDGDHFITFAIGAIDASSGSLKIVNAGHEPPLILREGFTSVETMFSRNLVLGVNHNERFIPEATQLGVGDLIVVYTDGLTEATNKQGELFTIECLKETVLSHRDLGSQQLAANLFDTVKTYAGQDLRDDATVLVMRRTH
ncbi:MAG: PP2C family protein-serine/threonine phosphatase [Candidatus Cybelea sp.]